MTSQKGDVSRNKNDSAEIKNDMRDDSKTICKEETSNPSVEEKNNNIFIYEEKKVTSKNGNQYSKEQYLSLVVEDVKKASQLVRSFDLWNLQILDKWLDEWKLAGIDVAPIQKAVAVQILSV